MEPLYFVLAIMGCGDGAQACTQARVEPIHYTSMLQCQAAMGGVLQRNSDLDYPELTAACRSNGERMVSREQPKRG